jgi:purine nucleosidase
MTKRILIDTDAGVDDAQAILLAFGQKDVKIEAFTTVNGNVGADKTTANVLKVLDVAGQDVPVYKGCERPLVSQAYHASYVHGEDGLGDCGIPASARKAESKHAVQALIDLANQNPSEISLIAIGPLTNLATAVQLDPDLPKKYADLTIMGGAILSKGNTNITAEFNVYVDPEAAYIVFEHWPKVRVLSWETTMAYTYSEQDLERFFALNTPKSKFFQKTNGVILKFIEERMHRKMLFAPDGLAVACAIDPSLITRKEDHYLSVELSGKNTRGETFVDWWNFGDKLANAELILEIDQKRFVQMMEDGLR